MRCSILLLSLIIFLLCFAGCSSSSKNPAQPESPMLPQAGVSDDGTALLYQGTFEIDLETQTITQYENREASTIYDITGFLPDKCPGGCFRFAIVGVVGNVLEIELTLENPLAIQAYDARVQYLDLFGKTVLNSDSYTDFLGTPITKVYPFTAFVKENPDRAFPVGPGGIDTETMYLDFPPGAPSAVNYAVTAHLPGNTPEPYEISEMAQAGTLTATGGSAIISCLVDDHQDNISGVYLDATPFTGAPVSFVFNDPLWEVEISNTAGASEGSYYQLIMALSPNGQNVSTYNYVEITVDDSVQWKNIRLRTDSAAKDLAVNPDGSLLILYDDAQVWKYNEGDYFGHAAADYLFTAEVKQWSELTPPPSPVLANAFIDVSDSGDIMASNADGSICEYPVGYYPTQSYDSLGNFHGESGAHCTGGPIIDVFCFKSGSGGYNLDHVMLAPGNSGDQSNMYRQSHYGWGWIQQYGQECHGSGYDKIRNIDVAGVESASVNEFWALEDSPDYYGALFIQDDFFYYHYADAYFGTGSQTEDDSCWYNAIDLTADEDGNLYVLDQLIDNSGRVKGFTGDVSGGTSLGHFDVPSQINSTPLRIESSDVSGVNGNLVFILHGDFATDGCFLSVFLPADIPWS